MTLSFLANRHTSEMLRDIAYARAVPKLPGSIIAALDKCFIRLNVVGPCANPLRSRFLRKNRLQCLRAKN